MVNPKVRYRPDEECTASQTGGKLDCRADGVVERKAPPHTWLFVSKSPQVIENKAWSPQEERKESKRVRNRLKKGDLQIGPNFEMSSGQTPHPGGFVWM
jgi:hypothetical protein